MTNKSFADLGVLPEIATALAEKDILSPFLIQELSLPISLTGKDLIGQAHTGTGKTLAFGITALQRLAKNPKLDSKPRALIMCPTRELAIQVANDLEMAGAKLKLKILCVYGGVSYDKQVKPLAKSSVDIIVGTPGRILDLVNRQDLELNAVEILVLDEADEMLDLGFLPDVETLISACPKERQTLLFSATMPAAILALSRNHLSQPVNIRAESETDSQTVPATAQFVYRAHDLDKPDFVAKILQAKNCEKTMIFTKTKRSADRLSRELQDRGFKARAIHGDMSQISRERALQKFREDKAKVLVATDVAARGIDISDVTHVINYECPDEENTYLHRIGRTGRAGASGVAVTLVDWADLPRWQIINKALALDFAELEETYSTSQHIYQDLDIDPKVRPWLQDPAAKGSLRRHNTPDSYLRDSQNKSRRTGVRKRRRLKDGKEISRPVEHSEEIVKPRVRIRRRLGIVDSE